MVASRVDLTRDGNALAVGNAAGPQTVLLRPELGESLVFQGTKEMAYVAITPDGRWVATGNYAGDGVQVWDGRTGELVRRLPAKGTATVAFSPDGRWLVTAATEYQFWTTGSWQPQRAIPGIVDIGGRMAFSPDDKVLAIVVSRNRVQLIETSTGRVLAELALTPEPARIQWLCFNPDGTRLAAACGSEGIRVWDLRGVRKQLAAVHLDWDMPPYPPTAPAADLKPLQVEVDLGPLAGAVHRQLGQLENALDDYSQAIRLDPNRYSVWHLRGHVYEDLQQWDEALSDLSKAIELRPDDAAVRRCRGLVYARRSQWSEATEDLKKAIELRPAANFRDEYELALVQLAAENTAGYQQACGDLLNQSGKTTDSNAASFTAWTCVLSATSEVAWPEVVALAERAVKTAGGDVSLSHTALGAALYRAGRFDQAVLQLTDADRRMTQAAATPLVSPAYAWFFLAMAHHRLDHQDEAQQWFEKALSWKKQYLEGESPDAAAAIPWVRQVTLNLLEKETRALLDD